jgi:DnaJ-class molecular chaperone
MDDAVYRNKDKTPPIKRRCHRCQGSSRAPCQACGGKGEVMTGRDIFNRPQFSRCTGCFGLKTTRCAVCGGDGMI